ncbi:MAG: DUF2029 domain-containing protein [Gemmataceae bacterium]|nr:DUF2029 domain-containing protein [Gemmataceae bacterium]
MKVHRGAGLFVCAKWHHAVLAVFALVAVLNARYIAKISSDQRDGRSAIVRWAPQLERLRHGADIWKEHNYPNPPIMALLLMPLTLLPTAIAALAWFWIKAALTVAAIMAVFAMLDGQSQSFPTWAKILTIGLSLRPIQGDLSHGNVNLLILFLLVMALLAYTRRREGWAGIVLALAIACKVTPALFLPYFAWKRAWRLLFGAMVGLALFLLVVPSLLFAVMLPFEVDMPLFQRLEAGWDRNLEFFKSWHSVMVHPYVVDGLVTSEHQNQSLPGLVYRLLTDSPAFSTYDGERYVPVGYANLASLDRQATVLLVKGCLMLYALAVVWRCRTPTDDRTDWRLSAEFAVIVLGMLLFSERTWKHHAVILLLPFAVICRVLAGEALSAGRRRLLSGSLVFAWLLMLSTSTGFWDVHDRLGKSAQVYGAYTVAFLVLFLTLLTMLGWTGCPVAKEQPARPGAAILT